MSGWLVLVVVCLVVVAIVQRGGHRSRAQLRLALFEVLAATVRRGLPLAPVVAWTAQEERWRRRAQLRQTAENLEDGMSLSRSLDLCAPLQLPMHVVATIRLAEGSPALAPVLDATALGFRGANDDSSRLRTYLAYPVIILVQATFLSGGILPKFREVFDAMDLVTPWTLLVVVDTVGWATEYLLLLAALLVVAPLLLRAAPRVLRSWRGGFQPIPQYIPVVRRTSRLRAAAAALRAMAADLAGGARFDEALTLGAVAGGSGPLSRSLDQAAEKARQGESPSAVWESTALPPLIRARAAAGFTGTTSVVAERIHRLAQQCSRDAVRADQRARRWAVPLISIALGTIVGAQMVAVFQCITSLQTVVAPW